MPIGDEETRPPLYKSTDCTFPGCARTSMTGTPSGFLAKSEAKRHVVEVHGVNRKKAHRFINVLYAETPGTPSMDKPQYEGRRPGNLNPENLRKYSTLDLNTKLAQLRQTMIALKGSADPAGKGYKQSPFKLSANRPHPRFVRQEIARILTILTERGEM